MANDDNFIRQFLKHRKFGNNIAQAVDEKTKRTSEEEEMKHRLEAEAMTKVIVNEMMPTFRKMMEEEQKAKEKPVRKIIMPDQGGKSFVFALVVIGSTTRCETLGNLFSHTQHIERNKMNPFELRFSVFNTAKDLMVKQHEANLATWEVLNKTSKEVTDLAPKFPTMEEIIDKAIEINTFVSGQTTKELTGLVKKMSGVSVIF